MIPLSLSIDATSSSSFGRLVNDADKTHANSKMRKVDDNGRIKLALFAIRPILKGEEISYDYGETQLEWRSQVRKLTSWKPSTRHMFSALKVCNFVCFKEVLNFTYYRKK